MSFTQYVSMLHKNALFFSRADKLNDSFEGSITNFDFFRRTVKLETLGINATDDMEIFNKNYVRNAILSCWHMNETESFAMWKVYLPQNEGLAIKSTYKRLRDSFPLYDGVPKERDKTGRSNERAIYIGTISYLDYHNGTMPQGNILWPFVHKRKYFEYENELRAFSFEFPIDNGTLIPTKTWFPDGGDYVPCCLKTLVDTVVVSPYTENWFLSLVIDVTNKYGCPFNIESSAMKDNPKY